MKKLFNIILIMALLFVMAGCSNTETIETDMKVSRDVKYEINYEYNEGYKAEIFGTLSDEEIEKVLNSIMTKVKENPNIEYASTGFLGKIFNPYEVNAELIVENVLKDYGITDTDMLTFAKDQITINKEKVED